MAEIDIPAEHLAHMGREYGVLHNLHSRNWGYLLRQIDHEFGHNAPNEYGTAKHWCDQVTQALTKTGQPLDDAAESRAYNILLYLLHWSASGQAIPHGFTGERRGGTEHTERLKKMMVSFWTCYHPLSERVRKHSG